ncbi:hypothetical protein AHU65_002180 [Salmonella enterica subsp. enterica]|nr:hypothetical protein [Salmonella enterica subsp. enterica serovar Miami]
MTKFLLLFILFLLWKPALCMEIIPTSIQDNACVKISEDEYTGATEHKCQGVGGYALRVFYDDNRMSLNVIYPDKTECPLELWDKVTHSFFSLDNMVQWYSVYDRGDITPLAIIIGVNNDNIDALEKNWWVIIRLNVDNACITDIVNKKEWSSNNIIGLVGASLSKPCLRFR